MSNILTSAHSDNVQKLINKLALDESSIAKLAIKEIKHNFLGKNIILYAFLEKYTNNNNTAVMLYFFDKGNFDLFSDMSINIRPLPCDKIDLHHDLSNELVNDLIEQGMIKLSSDGSYFLLSEFFPMEELLSI